MATGTGLDSQFGFVTESVYGTPVTVTRFVEFTSENIVTQFQPVDSVGLGAGVWKRSAHTRTLIVGAAGPITFDVMDHSFGLFFKHALGGMTSSQVGGSAEYRHRATLDANVLRGLSGTAQLGRPSVDGTVHPFTYHGVKVTEWELSAEWGQPVKLALTFDCEDVETGVALASASFASARVPFVYGDTATLTIAGSTVFARRISIRGTNNLDVDRRGVVSRLKREPLAGSTPPSVMVELTDAEFESLAHYNAIAANTMQAFVWTLEGATIPTTAAPFKLHTNIPVLRRLGEPPVVGGPGIVRTTVRAEALYNGTDNPCTIDYHTDDTSA